MRIDVIDGNGAPRNVIWQSTAVLTDRSGVIAADHVSQDLMVANADRAGWFFQNRSGRPMTISEYGADAELDSAITVYPNQSFPPPEYPLTLTKITVSGSIGDKYVAREW